MDNVFSFPADTLTQEFPDVTSASAAPLGTLAAEDITVQDFINDFRANPSKALKELQAFVEQGLVPGARATGWLFPLLVEARGELKERLYDMLLDLGEPESILRTALAEYARFGREERLTLAAALLGDLGARAWPSLRALARANLPECELFVPAIAFLPDVDAHDRLEVLGWLLANPSPEVRQGLLSALRAFSPREAQALLRQLATDADEEIAAEAQAQLETLET